MPCKHSKNIQEMLKEVFQPKIISCQLMLRHRSIHSDVHVSEALVEDLEVSAPWEMLESELVSISTLNPDDRSGTSLLSPRLKQVCFIYSQYCSASECYEPH